MRDHPHILVHTVSSAMLLCRNTIAMMWDECTIALHPFNRPTMLFVCVCLWMHKWIYWTIGQRYLIVCFSEIIIIVSWQLRIRLFAKTEKVHCTCPANAFWGNFSTNTILHQYRHRLHRGLCAVNDISILNTFVNLHCIFWEEQWKGAKVNPCERNLHNWLNE